jgi:hypothetical protein
MKKYLIGICFFSVSLIVIFACISYAAESGCVNCHTNEKMMRALHKPVNVDLSEGVG